MATPLYVGSEDTLVITVYDRLGSTRTPLDLSGTTVDLLASIDGAAADTWSCTLDPDQTNNPGKCTYALQPTDLPSAGKLELQAIVTVGARVYKSAVLVRDIKASLVASA